MCGNEVIFVAMNIERTDSKLDTQTSRWEPRLGGRKAEEV